MVARHLVEAFQLLRNYEIKCFARHVTSAKNEPNIAFHCRSEPVSYTHLYAASLNGSFVMKDLRQYKNEPAFLEGFTRMFNEYPELARDVLNDMFIVDGARRDIRE